MTLVSKCLPIFAFIHGMFYFASDGFLTLTFEVKICAIFSFTTIPQNLLILNLGMLSSSTLFLVLVAYAQICYFFFSSLSGFRKESVVFI